MAQEGEYDDSTDNESAHLQILYSFQSCHNDIFTTLIIHNSNSIQSSLYSTLLVKLDVEYIEVLKE